MIIFSECVKIKELKKAGLTIRGKLVVNSSNSQLKEPLKSELPLLTLRVFNFLRGVKMAEYNSQRFYWIKLTEKFMTSDTVDFLMEQKDGANYVVIYQMLCLKTINNDGCLSRKIGEVIIPYNVEKIQRDLKWFSIDTIRVALGLYRQLGLIYEQDDGSLKITDFDRLIGSQTISAEKKQEQRLKAKKPDLIGVDNCPPKCPPDIDKEKEIDLSTYERKKKEKDISISACARARESYETIMDDMELEEEVRPMLWNFIKHCQLNKRTLTNDKLASILVALDMKGYSASEKIEALQAAINGGYYDIKR